MSHYVVFLGAGASAAEGIPLQRDLFTSYFESLRSTGDGGPIADIVGTFFQVAFGIDVTRLRRGRLLPTFEEVLGIVDLAVARREALHGIPMEAAESNGLDLLTIRRSIVLALADAIRRTSPPAVALHSSMVLALQRQRRLPRTAFITTNYDTLIDDALYDHVARPQAGRDEPVVEYGFHEIVPSSPLGRARSAPLLLKIHGSLNWLHCPVCTDLVVTHGPDTSEGCSRTPAGPAAHDAARCASPSLCPQPTTRIFRTFTWLSSGLVR